MAGFVAPALSWIDFEQRARLYFDATKIPYLHTVDYHHGRGAFDGWDRDKRSAWANGLFIIARNHVPLAVAYTVNKDTYRSKTDNDGGKLSPLGFAFQLVFERLSRTPWFMDLLHEDERIDLSVIYESGHKNVDNVVEHFKRMKNGSRAARLRLKELKIADKKVYAALQIADFNAYFTRRIIARGPAATRAEDEVKFFEAIMTGMHQVRFWATDFNV